MRNLEEAVAVALASETNVPGTCQLWTRNLFLAPSAGDRDGDGDSDAVDGWKSEPKKWQHTTRQPPRGKPVAWGGGTHGFGHRAVSLGRFKDGHWYIRTTDGNGSGHVATRRLEWVEETWGLNYLGWSDSITGILIPEAPKPKTGRGKNVDAALDALKNAKGRGKRGSLIERARKLLQRIRPTRP